MCSSIAVYEGFQFSPACCTGTNSIKVKTNMEHSVSHNYRGKKEHSEKSLPSATLFTAHLTRSGARLKISLNNTLWYLRPRKHRLYAL